MRDARHDERSNEDRAERRESVQKIMRRSKAPTAGDRLPAQEQAQEHQYRGNPAACREQVDQARSKPQRTGRAFTGGGVAVPCQRSKCAARQHCQPRKGGLHLSAAALPSEHDERGKHEPQLKTAKRLAEVLGIPPAFLYTEDDLLAALLLRWNELSLRQKKDLLKQVEGVELSKSKRGRLPGK